MNNVNPFQSPNTVYQELQPTASSVQGQEWSTSSLSVGENERVQAAANQSLHAVNTGESFNYWGDDSKSNAPSMQSETVSSFEHTYMTPPMIRSEVIKLIKEGNYDAALAFLNRFPSEVAVSLPLLYLKGVICCNLKDYSAASKAYSAILKVNKNNPSALLGLVGIYHETNREKLAITLLQKIEREFPDHLPAQLAVIPLYISSGEYNYALGRLNYFLSTHPSNGDLLFLKVKALSGLGRREEAKQVARQLLNHRPRVRMWAEAAEGICKELLSTPVSIPAIVINSRH